MSPALKQESPRRLCVFSGSSTGISPAYECAARRLGEQLARSGIALVYGGAAVGLMGAVADAVLAGGGQVIGVIPQRSEEHTSELQSLMRISYAVFCLKKK